MEERILLFFSRRSGSIDPPPFDSSTISRTTLAVPDRSSRRISYKGSFDNSHGSYNVSRKMKNAWKESVYGSRIVGLFGVSSRDGLVLGNLAVQGHRWTTSQLIARRRPSLLPQGSEPRPSAFTVRPLARETEIRSLTCLMTSARP